MIIAAIIPSKIEIGAILRSSLSNSSLGSEIKSFQRNLHFPGLLRLFKNRSISFFLLRYNRRRTNRRIRESTEYEAKLVD